ncbi:MAG: permease prefix domain 1-containing protein [Propionibacteriaceae bacterium]
MRRSTEWAADPIEDTIRALAARLPAGGPGRRASLLLEARQGLEDAAESHRQSGLDARAAAQRAVREFGDLDELSEDYAAQVVTGSVRLASLTLGVGYLLILSAWGLVGQFAPDRQPHGSVTAAMSFTWIGCVAVGLTVFVLAGVRSLARRGAGSARLSWVVGTVGLACAVTTLVASYLVRPWGSDGVPPHGVTLMVSAVEMLSGAITFSILALSLLCLRSAWTMSRRTSSAVAGSRSGSTASDAA